jgi:hypothetical protein
MQGCCGSVTPSAAILLIVLALFNALMSAGRR